MKKYFLKLIYIYLFISFSLIITVSCNLFPLEETQSITEKKLINDGYTPLIDDDIEGFWYKNINNEVTRYILEEEYLHSSQYYLDAYFFIEIDKTNEVKLKIKSRTKSSSLNDMFIPRYVIYQPFNYKTTSIENKIPLEWDSDVDYKNYTSEDYYYLWCETTIINDEDKTLNSLLKMFNDNENIYFYFSNGYQITNIKKLTLTLKNRIIKTLNLFTTKKNLLIYYTP
jgi:hypothetical protein